MGFCRDWKGFSTEERNESFCIVGDREEYIELDYSTLNELIHALKVIKQQQE